MTAGAAVTRLAAPFGPSPAAWLFVVGSAASVAADLDRRRPRLLLAALVGGLYAILAGLVKAADEDLLLVVVLVLGTVMATRFARAIAGREGGAGTSAARAFLVAGALGFLLVVAGQLLLSIAGASDADFEGAVAGLFATAPLLVPAPE